MLLYLHDTNLRRIKVVDSFESLIWTERFYTAGEAVLKIAANSPLVREMVYGAGLSIQDSQRVMTVESVVTEDDVTTVTARDLLNVLNNRLYNALDSNKPRPWSQKGRFMKGLPHSIMHIIFRDSVIYNSIIGVYDLNATSQIPFEIFGSGSTPNVWTEGDLTSDLYRRDVWTEFGPLLPELEAIGRRYGVGQSIRYFVDQAGTHLRYYLTKGNDRTSGQSVNPVVRFSAELGTLDQVSILESYAKYYDCVVIFPDPDATYYYTAGGQPVASTVVVYGDGVRQKPWHMRRIKHIRHKIEDDPGTKAAVDAQMRQLGEDILAESEPVRLVDGQIGVQSQHKLGKTYLLGDIVELEPQPGLILKARVTEHVRTHDASGEREYPTISVIR